MITKSLFITVNDSFGLAMVAAHFCQSPNHKWSIIEQG
jgi:hypothetical protein